ncbi:MULTISPECIES: hypothetical protein [Brevibacillus]|jgi:hypothetical protein|uniref:hypothetical protein n=1 Tax=Brevibacillus TaxID=55080 RepID=UPI0004F3CC0E|nr:hypothetical protein [Brevibacillus borstelensis]KKX53657.1 hypothetical protein X546_18575 [Brevibacillus borstelensis cifa_chp40]MBE5394416.1 hypothetical protein [Brevibacillus borstelensis]MCM3622869.1 hypothetical protein [Brevibacillus borstelensis]MED1743951.1 hypothetical protein [Brevibacillus borstelensis]MED1876511.1 hypothetical protein [Brevibacillus borstelensis]
MWPIIGFFLLACIAVVVYIVVESSIERHVESILTATILKLLVLFLIGMAIYKTLPNLGDTFAP